MTPAGEFILSRVLLQVEPSGNDSSLQTDWYPGVVLVLVIFGTWLFWRYSRKAGERRKLP